eukprot:CAMPEP_0173111470 /NCGR_PEP_ID=MMETSP1102-20130122/45204_1 /TAXON_ID=49646 /ORGANISM="Geminigera sp., Strain Caron Lab Isolate" /LENGTH=53 /DNA_ID=CAMNT_0014011881 /DNA_START=57 /DNA_END=214 /DNA_ORIENTATION=-
MLQYLQDPVAGHTRAGISLTSPASGKPEKMKLTASTTQCLARPSIVQVVRHGG